MVIKSTPRLLKSKAAPEKRSGRNASVPESTGEDAEIKKVPLSAAALQLFNQMQEVDFAEGAAKFMSMSPREMGEAARKAEAGPQSLAVSRAHIVVIAGVNGSGKSSVAGEALRGAGVPFFNPDLHTKTLIDENPGLTLGKANAQAWNDGVALLKLALATDKNFAFETTLGGDTITNLLIAGAKRGAKIDMHYVGLISADLNIRRVANRVAKGGHDIPETMIRKRFESSPRNLIRLMPFLAELKLYDNSDDADPKAGKAPEPQAAVAHARRQSHFQGRGDDPEGSRLGRSADRERA